MKTPTLITFAGAAGSGKDTIATVVAEELGYQVDRFAKPLYDFIQSITGYTYEQLQDKTIKNTVIPWLGKSPRQLLQSAGTEWGRDMIREDLWAKCLEHRNRDLLCPPEGEDSTGLIVPDGRFTNEADFTKAYDGVLVYVIRPELVTIEDSDHRSENGLAADDCDMTILNDRDIGAIYKRVSIIIAGLQAVHDENLRIKSRNEDGS